MERILIVDDNKDFLKEIKETLFLCGYETKVVCDGPAVIEAAARIKPDVILLDLRMNKMNGFEVAEQLKKTRQTSGIPIIAMSGYFPIEKESVLLDLSNMKSCIKKPFAVLDLINHIESALSKKENKEVAYVSS